MQQNTPQQIAGDFSRMIEELKNYIKVSYNLQKLRFFGSSEIRQIKRIRKLISLAAYNIHLGLRLADESARQLGQDHQKDQLFKVATLKITHPEYFTDTYDIKPISGDEDKVNELKNDYKSQKEAIDQIIHNAYSLYFFVKWHQIYLQSRHLLFKEYSKDNAYIEIYEAEISRYPNCEKISFSDVKLCTSAALSDRRIATTEISGRDSIKFDVGINDINSLIGIMSALTITSGFIYSYLYYGYFGISTSYYFTISDYLAASIESIYFCFIAAAVFILTMLLGAHNSSRQNRNHQVIKPKKDRFNINVLLLSLLMTASGLIIGGKTLHNNISFALLLISMIIVPRIIQKHFKSYFRSMMAVMIVITFSTQIYAKAYGNIITTIKEAEDNSKCSSVTFSNSFPIPFDLCAVSVIGGTSNYLFFYAIENDRAFVIPKSQITMSTHDADAKSGNVIDMLSQYIRQRIGIKPIDRDS